MRCHKARKPHKDKKFAADAVEEEAEASIPLQTSEMSEDTAEEEISSRYVYLSCYAMSLLLLIIQLWGHT